jgi:hypothetical protein
MAANTLLGREGFPSERERPSTSVQFEADLIDGQFAASQAGKLVIKTQNGSMTAVFTNASMTRERPPRHGQPP